MNDKNQFSLSYGRRIERPDYSDLNPFYYFLDKYTYQVGNPYLSPQFSHNIELSHSFSGILNTTLGYSNINNIIQQVLEQVDSTHTTFVKQSNIAKQQSLTLSVNANVPVTKWWRANIYTQFMYNEYKGYVNNGEINVSGPGFMTNITNQFTIKNGWSLELSGFYRGKMVEGTMVSKPMGVVNFAVAKNILKTKAASSLISATSSIYRNSMDTVNTRISMLISATSGITGLLTLVSPTGSAKAKQQRNRVTQFSRRRTQPRKGRQKLTISMVSNKEKPAYNN